MLGDRDIVVLASAPWKTVGPINCHHIALRLAEHNRVLYVESPGLRSPNLLHKADLLKIAGRLRGWMRCAVSGPERMAPNLYVVSPIIVPFRGRSCTERLNDILLRRACAGAALRLHFRRPILWTFLPTSFCLVGCLNEAAVVYHCTDDYAGNPGVDASWIEGEERRLAGAADLCLATSHPLAARLRAMGAKVACVPNVAETHRFAQPPLRIPADLASLPRPIVGYVGNIAAYMTDLELLAGIAESRPEWSLVLVGPVGTGDPSTRLSALRRYGNVSLLGPRRYEEIPNYVHGFDVCLIPFRRNRVTDGAIPLKTFEYLAAGKPVVCTPLAALRAEPLGDVLCYAEGTEEFVRAIELCLADSGGDSTARRREVAERYCWSKRFPEIEDLVSEVLG